LSSSTAAAATVEDAVTAAMRSAMRALDVVEARLRSLLDSADVDGRDDAQLGVSCRSPG
jgi:hypothetical protein